MRNSILLKITFITFATTLSVVSEVASVQAVSFTGLGDLEGGDFNSQAFGVSADGSIIVGRSVTANGTEAFRWTVSEGMQGLGDLEGGDFLSQAFGVSADGTTIVGVSGTANNLEAFRWTESEGMLSIKNLLEQNGLDLSGWKLDEAWGVSADGSTIVGYGVNPDGFTEAWVAQLDTHPIPEPLTILGSLTALGFGTLFKKKKLSSKTQ